MSRILFADMKCLQVRVSKRILGSVLALVPSLVSALGAGEVTKTTVMRASPEASSGEVGKLKQGLKVTTSERRGFWYLVEAEGKSGWVKLTDVKLATGESAGAGLAAMATGRGATGNVVSTSGSRGLSAEELSSATPDHEALKAVDGMAVSLQDAEKFAQEGKLSPRQLDYLQAPATKKKGKR